MRSLLWVALVVLAACSTTEKPASAPARSAPGVALTLWNGSPYLDLTIGGARGRFLLDTGANTSGVDRAWLEATQLTSASTSGATVGGTTGAVAAGRAVLPRFDLGHGFFDQPVFLVEDLSSFAKPGGERQAGILGTDFLACYAVTLDLGARRATFALRDEREPAREGDAALPLENALNLPTVRVALAGVPVPCRIDTGATYLDASPYLDVNEPLVSQLKVAGVKLHEKGSLTVRSVSGAESLSLLEAEPPLVLAVGPVRMEGVVLVLHRRGTLATNAPLALAGAPLLARLGRFTIDFFDRALVLRR